MAKVGRDLAWRWNRRKERAAALVADDKLSNEEIAERVGITRQGLDKWKLVPEFTAAVSELVEAYRERVRAKGIAIVENRVAALDDRWKLLQQVIEQRAADESIHHVPGGKTGLIVRQTKFVKVYDVLPVKREPAGNNDGGEPEHIPEQEVILPTKRTELVEEFAIDTGLLSELRAHELQAAKELGQLTEKRDITSGGKTLGDLLSTLSDDDLEDRIAQAESGKAAPSVSP